MSHSHHHHHRPEEGAAPSHSDAASASLTSALRATFLLLKIVIIVLLFFFLLSGVKMIEKDQIALVLRFGKITGKVGQPEKKIRTSGLCWALPYPIDEVIPMPANAVNTIEVDDLWYKVSDDERLSGEEQPVEADSGLMPGEGGYVITGDANIVHIRMAVRYRVHDPVLYFERIGDDVTDAAPIVRSLAKGSVNRIAGHRLADDIIREDITSFRGQVEKELARALEAERTGLTLVGVDIDSTPPRQVKTAFDSVVRATNERGTKRQMAEQVAATTREQARGNQARTIQEAETYKKRVVEEAAADADYLRKLLATYPDDPAALEVFAEHQHIEVLARVLAGADAKFVLRSGDEDGERELRLLLNIDPADRTKVVAERRKRRDEEKDKKEGQP